MEESRTVDLLVIGAGPAGMTAALVASLEGLDVLLCEKTDQVGGTGATSAGTLWIPGNTQSKAAGYDDSADKADIYLSGLIGAGTNRVLRDAYLQTGPKAIDYLTAKTDVQFLTCGTHPDYRSNMAGAAISGRAIVPVPFDGRLLGRHFRRVRAPIREFLVFGGMMVGKPDIAPLIGRFKSAANFIYAAKLFARYLSDRLRYPRGTRLMLGNALVARLFYSLCKRDVPILFDTSLKDLVHDGAGVTGAILSSSDGDLPVTTRRGVVLATGGYAHNEQLRRRFMPKASPIYSLSFAGNEGEGVSAAERAGARLGPDNITSGLWSPVSIVKRRDGSTGLYPHLAFDRAKPGLIAVNAEGRRFVNEACSYHDFVLAMIETNDTAKAIPAWLVCDAPFLKKYGLGVIYPGHSNPGRFVDEGCLVRASTLDELANKIGVDAAGLRDSVARNNRYAESGIDADFAKGETELNRFNGDAGHKPNPCIGPIATPPFYALAVWPADIAVSTGVLTDADGRALDNDGKVIPGLYACGNDMASVMGGSYPGPGTTLGPAVVFAYRAAMRAKAETL
ncbi:MAG: Succinate dehydrogenase/fumarate reductase, flavoprotein subunit [Pseudolabrys sp.]|jgi:succinate dehydrogenase/fumarate reductase flavoprotein subunit|nr:Succinate dehydrogenase/fumarate reductase, flavoprotein subunit [Pseudolabrys sp.]